MRKCHPTDGAVARRDRAIQAHPVDPCREFLGFRVHWRIVACDGHDTRRVTDVLFEVDAASFASHVDTTPGLELVEAPGRPRGLESVYGWRRSSTVARDPFAWQRARISAAARSAVDHVALRAAALPVLATLPTDVATDMWSDAVAEHRRANRP